MPNVRGLMVTGPLADISIRYKNGIYISDQVFPIIDKVAPKAKIAKYQKGAWFRDEAAIRAPGAEAPRGDYGIDFIDLNTKEYAFAMPVTDEDRRNARVQGAPPLNPDQDSIEMATDKIDLKKERRVAETVLTGTWSGVAGEDAEGLWAASTSKTSPSTNTMISDIETRIETIRSTTGFRPNRLIITANLLPEIKQNAEVLDRIKYTERGIVSAPLIAAVFDLEQVLIGDSIYSIAKETKAGTDFTARNVWEKNNGKGSAFLYYAPKSPGLKIPSAGYQARIAYENGQSRRTTTWREDARHQDVYEVAEETCVVQACSDLGFLWYDCIAT
jgi:hypothetical protein